MPAGEIRHQFTHVIDVVPTILEYAGLPQPQTVNGVEQKAIEGTSFKYAVDDAQAEERHHVQYFEMGGSRGIYHDGWSAVTPHLLPWPDPDYVIPGLTEDVWELYGPDDWTQARNLADEQPEMLQKLREHFLIEATKYNVFPIDDRQRERFDPKIAGRQDLMSGRTELTLRPGMTRLNENTVLNVKNTSFTVTATISVPEGDPARGALIAQGGSFGGWTLYFHEGLLTYAHNFVGMQTYTVRATEAVGSGDHVVEVRFAYDGGGAGKGGEATLLCDGTEIGRGRVERTVPGLFSFDEGLDVGLDSLDPVVEDYGTPKGAFNGRIETVVVNIDPNAEHDPELVLRARYRKQ